MLVQVAHAEDRLVLNSKQDGFVAIQLQEIGQMPAIEIASARRSQRSPLGETNLVAIELGAEMVEGSVSDKESMRNAMKDVDMVMHFAAMYEIGKVDEKQMYNANVVGTQNVFDLIQELEIPKSIYCSTEEALGHQKEVITENSEHPGNFLSYYEETKHLAHKLWQQCCGEGLDTITVMPCGVLGPGDTKFTGQFIINYIQGGRF